MVRDPDTEDRARIRRARDADAEAMASVIAEVAREGVLGTEPPVDVAARAARYREWLQRPEPAACFVAESAGRVVGGADLHITHADGVLALGIALVPAARGTGAGRALMSALIEHARSAGSHKLELEVWPENGRAIAFYAGCGFTVEGVRRDHYRRRDGSLRSSLLMARRLDGR